MKIMCKDKKCPIHGQIIPRGKTFTGRIVKSDMHGTVTVEWTRLYYLKKYERYERRRTRVKAHNSKCLNAKVGDIVEIKECRPISKTKHFVVTKISNPHKQEKGKVNENQKLAKRTEQKVRKPRVKKQMVLE